MKKERKGIIKDIQIVKGVSEEPDYEAVLAEVKKSCDTSDTPALFKNHAMFFIQC